MPRVSSAAYSRKELRSLLAQLDSKQALEDLLQLLAIPGPSTQEGEVIRFLQTRLREGGYRPSQMTLDPVQEKSPLGGEVGSLVLCLPGTRPGPRRLLMAHVDTVPLCVGSRPVVRGRWIRSADPQTALGADNRAGAAVLLHVALELRRLGLEHPPLTFFWPVQEEVGLFGARFADLKRLGRPRLAFNWDGGDPCKLTIGATGAYRMEIHIHGQASHAGAAPEQGVSAAAVAALAIAQLQQDGWHGRIEKHGQLGTSNIGVLQGGSATNVVMDHLLVRAEVRSHDPKFRKQILQQFRQAFHQAAQQVQSARGKRARVRFHAQLDYESFVLGRSEPCVQAAWQAVRHLGSQPQLAVANGGLDANWLTARGVPTVSLGCGQENQHTTAERLRLSWFAKACKIAMILALGAESAAAE